MATLATSTLTLGQIEDMPDKQPQEIFNKVQALITNGYVNQEPQGSGDPAIEKMEEAEFIALGWEGTMDTFMNLSLGKKGKQTKTGVTKMKKVLDALMREAQEREEGGQQQGAEKQDAQPGIFDINPPAQTRVGEENFQAQMNLANFENANLGPAVNGDVFEDFSLGAPLMPHPDKIAGKTIKQIQQLLDQLGPPQVDYSGAKRKQDYIDLYRQNYPQSPVFSPQSPPMMGVGSSSSSGMSKEGVGSSSKSSGVSGVNLNENISEVIINDQPASTEVARTYANMGPNILLTAMRRGTQGHAMHGKGSLSRPTGRTNYNNLVSGVTQRLQNATNFFETNKKVFYLFTGRVNVGTGQSVALQIHPGQGNNYLPTGMHHPGYTTFVVASLQPDGVTLTGPPSITEFGVYPFVAKTYGYLPDVLASDPANAPLDPLKLDVDVLQENCLFVPNQGGGGHFCMQVPISREIQTPGQLLSGASNNDDSTRMNLLFYMRPDELADCFEQGLFHQLEYYSDKFKTTITARLAVHTQNFKLKNGNKNPTFIEYLTIILFGTSRRSNMSKVKKKQTNNILQEI